MSSPSPFAVAREIGTNLHKAFREQKDENAIERILSESMQSGDPKVLQNNIGKILSQVSPERQGPALQYIQGLHSNIVKKQEQQQQFERERQAGLTPGLAPAVQAQQLRNMQPAKPAGGLSGQPVPQDVSKAIPAILEANKDANADALAVAFDSASIPRAYSNSYIENRRKQDEAPKPGKEFANIREKSIADYVNNSISEGEKAESLKHSIASTRKAVRGDVAGPGFQAVLKNNPYAQLLYGLTPDEALLQASNKGLLEGTKGIFGSKPTEREIFLLLNSMLPSIGKTVEANEAGLDFVERVNDMKILHAEIVEELTEGGTKYVPDLEKRVNARLRPEAEKLRNDLIEADKIYNKNEKSTSQVNNPGKNLKVRAPDGSLWEMTQQQIEAAKAKDVIFEPV